MDRLDRAIQNKDFCQVYTSEKSVCIFLKLRRHFLNLLARYNIALYNNKLQNNLDSIELIHQESDGQRFLPNEISIETNQNIIIVRE